MWIHLVIVLHLGFHFVNANYHSLAEALMTVFPEFQWMPFHFARPPSGTRQFTDAQTAYINLLGYWDDESNVQAFIEYIRNELQIKYVLFHSLF